MRIEQRALLDILPLSFHVAFVVKNDAAHRCVACIRHIRVALSRGHLFFLFLHSPEPLHLLLLYLRMA